MLPSRPHVQRSFPDDISHIKPGTYWRYVGDEGEYLGHKVPEHGLVILLSEVRWVDGEIHTLIMKSHPNWVQSSSFRMLLEEFQTEWVLEPQADTVREMELSEVMSRINDITGRISSEPPKEELQRLIGVHKAEKASSNPPAADDGQKDQPKSTNVPAALLPSQDIVAAQQKIEATLAEMNARSTYIQNLTSAMQNEMKLVTGFQQEKVAQSLASVSEVTEKATGLLKNVKTMRLFLGEESESITLREGKPAPAEEPLTFMQRLLYLDEEIFIEGQMEGGFTYEDQGDLKEILVNHPSIVERMMPYQRCVVLARLRRNSRQRDFEEKMTLADLFLNMNQDQADKRILMFVRNGENLHVVLADEQTSGAQRLFPSAKEIDGIFTERHYTPDGSETRQISVQSLQYSDRRAQHDDVALHYKRFLLLLWGLHEREGVFGDFFPKGENWLDQTVHSEKFRFIHDEEEVLSDGRPSLGEYLSSVQAKVTTGSRIAVVWSNVLSTESAPSMYHSSWGYSDRAMLKAYPIEKREIVTVFEKDGELYTKCLAEQDSHSNDKKPRNYTVKLAQGSYRRGEDKDGRGIEVFERSSDFKFVCVDSVQLEDLYYYMNSRAARVQYLRYIHLFAMICNVLEAERTQLSSVFAKLQKTCPTAASETIYKAITFWRRNKKHKFPQKDTEVAAIAKIVTRIEDALTYSDEEVLFAAVNMKGNLIIGRESNAFKFAGHQSGLVDVEEIQVMKLANNKVVSQSTMPISVFERDTKVLMVAESEIIDEVRTASARRINRNVFYENGNAEDFSYDIETLEYARSGKWFDKDAIDAIMKVDGDQAQEYMKQLRSFNSMSGSTYVSNDHYMQDVGLVIAKDDEKVDFRAYWISIGVQMYSHLYSLGHEVAIIAGVKKFYKDPERVIENIRSGKYTHAGLYTFIRPVSFNCSLEDDCHFAFEYNNDATVMKTPEGRDPQTLEELVKDHLEASAGFVVWGGKPTPPKGDPEVLICDEAAKLFMETWKNQIKV